MIMLLIIGVLGVLILVHGRRSASTASAAEEATVRGVGATLDHISASTSVQRCAVYGTAVSAGGHGPDKAPLSERDAVWWRLQIHPRGPRTSRGIDLPQAETSERAFDLVEGDHRIRVEPDSAMAHGPTARASYEELHTQTFVDRRTPVTDRIKARFPRVRERLSGMVVRKVDFTEWHVPEGTPTTVMGWVTVDGATGEPVIRARRSPEDGPTLSISAGSTLGTRELRRQSRGAAIVGWSFVVFGFGVLLLGLPAWLSDVFG
ncbi:hypothetical protein ACFO4E_19720 [Nocardiopsis mangrovi]|uniref:RING-type E3 ubiquitin transferase n=1 Tax=Nocardiopsis mangrovi TaxID=1179818 RepID=A0ABV9DZ23_9ACTN